MVYSSLLMEKVGMNSTNYSFYLYLWKIGFISLYGNVDYGFAMKANYMLPSVIRFQ